VQFLRQKPSRPVDPVARSRSEETCCNAILSKLLLHHIVGSARSRKIRHYFKRGRTGKTTTTHPGSVLRMLSGIAAGTFGRISKSDPLAMLSFSSGSSSFASRKRRKLATTRGQAPDPRTKKEGKANDGGFLQEIDLPERLKRKQKEQEELQNQQLARMNQAASAARRASRITSTITPTTVRKRRKGSGKSIWNLAMDKGRDGKLSTVAESYRAGAKDSAEMNVSCTCGSKDVRNFGNITSRNQDVRKGEIWGTGRGEEVINRFQCNVCGRTWNEAE